MADNGREDSVCDTCCYIICCLIEELVHLLFLRVFLRNYILSLRLIHTCENVSLCIKWPKSILAALQGEHSIRTDAQTDYL